MLTQADEARTETENAKIKEKVQLEVLGSYDDNGIFKMEKLKENLEKNLNIAKEEITDNGDGSITFLLDETKVTVDEEGKVELGEKVPLIKATKIEVEDLVIEEGTKTGKLKVTTTPSEITENLIYTSKNTEIITVDNEGNVKVKGEGEAKVEVEGEKSGVKGECTVTVKFGVGVKVTGENKKYTNNGTAVIPVGFSIVPGCNDVSEGLVISDNDEDTEADKDNIKANGNQFVWVPVDFSEFKRENGWKSGARETYEFVSDKITAGKWYEPAGDGVTVNESATEREKEAQEMYKSVKDNGGFYIGRYEAGTTDENINGTGIRGELVCKKGMTIYNNIGWAEENDMVTETGGAVQLSREFDTDQGYTSVKSTLCYGVQWDAVMKWMKDIENPYAKNEDVSKNKYIIDSTEMGWYSENYSELNPNHKTGIDIGTGENNKSNKVKNIYDMGGNVQEWTMEVALLDTIVMRGGRYLNYGSFATVSTRGNNLPNNGVIDVGFRITLYL